MRSVLFPMENRLCAKWLWCTGFGVLHAPQMSLVSEMFWAFMKSNFHKKQERIGQFFLVLGILSNQCTPIGQNVAHAFLERPKVAKSGAKAIVFDTQPLTQSVLLSMVSLVLMVMDSKLVRDACGRPKLFLVFSLRDLRILFQLVVAYLLQFFEAILFNKTSWRNDASCHTTHSQIYSLVMIFIFHCSYWFNIIANSPH